MDNIKVPIKMFKAEIDVVNFTSDQEGSVSTLM